MLKDIIEVQHLSKFKIYPRFEDGVEGELDISSFISFDGVFESLKEPGESAKYVIALHTVQATRLIQRIFLEFVLFGVYSVALNYSTE